MFMLAGCNNGGEASHATGLSISGEPSSEPGTSEEEQAKGPYYVQGKSTGFPTEIVKEFMEYYGLDYPLPESFGSETLEWDYGADLTNSRQAYLFLSCEDTGTAGEDAFEDGMKAYLEEQGLTVSAEHYDTWGYEVLDETGENILICFYSYKGIFNFWAYGPYLSFEDLGFTKVSYFPTDVVNDYIKNSLEMEATFPEVSVSQDLYYTVNEDDELQIAGYDNGTPGEDAIEDKVKAALEGATGWSVDDSSYEYDGYYAYYEGLDNLEVFFYSYEGEFAFFVYYVESGLVPELDS